MLKALKNSNINLEFLYKNSTDKFRFIEEYIKHNQLSNIMINVDEIGYYDRHSKIQRTGGLIVLTNNTLESYTTLRLRIRDALFYKKPLIVSKYGLLGKFVEENNIGITTENNSKSIKKSIHDLFQPQNYFSFVDSLKHLSEKHLYDNTLNDVYKFIYHTNV